MVFFMRPSANNGEAGILNSRVECEILKDYLTSADYLIWMARSLEGNPAGVGADQRARNLIGKRFFGTITRKDEITNISAVKDGAEFAITTDEVPIALAAAEKVLRAKNPVYRIRDRLNGRTDAAIGMSNFLGSISR